MKQNLSSLKRDLRMLANPNKISSYQRFFKTGKGEYGEGDIFIGATVPNSRIIAAKYKDLLLPNIKELLKSKIHEERMVALIILVNQYKKSNEENKLKIVNFYLDLTKHINSWDLVDTSAHKIIGDYLFKHHDCTTSFKGSTLKGNKLLYYLSKSDKLWDRRIAVISTFANISNNSLDLSLDIAEKLINDKEDLINKAVGWMLREVGKKDKIKLENFLKIHISTMPRTTLRYALEKFSKEEREKYMGIKKP